MPAEHTISSFQIHLMEHLEKKYSGTQYLLGADEINEYIFMLFDILINRKTKKDKIREINKIKMLGSKGSLFNKKESSFIGDNYSKVAKDFIELAPSREGGGHVFARSRRPERCRKHTIQILESLAKGMTSKVANNLKNHIDILKILQELRNKLGNGPDMKLLDQGREFIDAEIPYIIPTTSLDPGIIEKNILRKFMEKIISFIIERTKGEKEKQALKKILLEVEDNLLKNFIKEEGDVTGNIIKDFTVYIESIIMAVIGSFLSEAFDADTDLIGGVLPLAALINMLNTLVMCNPERALLFLQLLLPKKFGGSEYNLLKLLLLISITSAGIDCCGEKSLGINPHKNEGGEDIIERALDTTLRQFISILKKSYDVKNKISKIKATVENPNAVLAKAKEAVAEHVTKATTHVSRLADKATASATGGGKVKTLTIR